MKRTFNNTIRPTYVFKISTSMAHEWINYVRKFESVPTHAQTLGTAMLGLSKMNFLPKDEQALFDIFNIDYAEWRKAVHSVDEVDPSFNIASNPYNLLTIWLVHLTTKSGLPTSVDLELRKALLRMLHYKYFTSIVNHSLKHGADEGTMRYTIDELNMKSDIKRSGTWKKLIAERVDELLDSRSIHTEAFNNFEPDKAVINVLSDTQTNLRKKLIRVICRYYENKEAGNRVGSSNMVDEINGDRVLKTIDGSMDTLVVAVSNSCTNLNEFIDHEGIEAAISTTNDTDSDQFYRLLVRFSAMAEIQARKGHSELQRGNKDAPLYVGYRILVRHILQKTYRICALDRDTKMNSKVAILQKTANVYKSSRIKDPDVIAIKESVGSFIEAHSNSKRPATNSSLRIAFLRYVMYLSFKHM